MNRNVVFRFALATLAIAVAACTSAAPSPRLGIGWGRVASVERPASFEETVSPTYQAKHPILRIHGQATMADVAALATGADGTMVAVGRSGNEPVAWTTTNGVRWARRSVPDSYVPEVWITPGG